MIKSLKNTYFDKRRTNIREIPVAFAIFAIVTTLSVCSKETSSISGHWSGFSALGDDTTRFELQFDAKDSLTGTWSLPEIGMVRRPFQQLEFETRTNTLIGDSHFFNGELKEDNLSGTLSWHHATASFQLEKTKRQPLSYVEKEITFSNGSFTLAGTLIFPKSKGPYSAVVFLHGSGISTRGWEIYYAEHFSRLGIASLIFDKRGSGASGGSLTTSSLDDLATDAVSAINYLKSTKQIDAKRIGVWGISQGG